VAGEIEVQERLLEVLSKLSNTLSNLTVQLSKPLSVQRSEQASPPQNTPGVSSFFSLKGRGKVIPETAKRRPRNEAEGIFWDESLETGWELTKRGWPDFFCLRDGEMRVVEIKPSGDQDLKAAQLIVMQALTAYGVPCYRWDPDMGFEPIEPQPLGEPERPSRRRRRAKAEYSEAFLTFWAHYPRREGKGRAWSYWRRDKLDRHLEEMLSKIEQYKQTEQWTKDNGQFIPHPATWLNDRRWEDELPEAPTRTKLVRRVRVPDHEGPSGEPSSAGWLVGEDVGVGGSQGGAGVSPTKIEWAEEVWNPVTGCTKVSPGCRNCYAERMAKRLRGRFGYPQDDPFRVTIHEDRLDEPLRWRKPRRVFVCSMGDLFHEDVPDEFIARVFSVARGCPDHTFLVLTKRPERARAFLRACGQWDGWFTHNGRPPKGYTMEDPGVIVGHDYVRDVETGEVTARKNWPLENVWLGVSCEDQERADERIPILLDTPAAMRFVSLEPLLGEVDVSSFLCGEEDGGAAWRPGGCARYSPPLDWVIVGSETGPGARPMHPDWARSVRSQCQSAAVPFFFKQMAGREPIPEDLLIREVPA
jgi:protein gp37